MYLYESEQVAMSLHLVGEDQQAGSKDRGFQLQNNKNFRAAGGQNFWALIHQLGRVVCCRWTQSGSHRLLLQGQTRLQWLQPKIGLVRNPSSLESPKKAALLYLFVLFYS